MRSFGVHVHIPLQCWHLLTFVSQGQMIHLLFFDISLSHWRKIFGPHICGDSLDIDQYHNHIVTGSWRKDNNLQVRHDMICLYLVLVHPHYFQYSVAIVIITLAQWCTSDISSDLFHQIVRFIGRNQCYWRHCLRTYLSFQWWKCIPFSLDIKLQRNILSIIT